MITVISATNRPGNQTQKVAFKYKEILLEMGENVNYFSLEALPSDFIVSDLYGKRSEEFKNIIETYLIPASKFVIIAPEYNGSFPGILKVFMDACNPEIFYTKKVALVGTSVGRAGNLRGMDHLTNMLNYIQMLVLPFKVPISSIGGLVSENELTDQPTINLLKQQADKLFRF